RAVHFSCLSGAVIYHGGFNFVAQNRSPNGDANFVENKALFDYSKLSDGEGDYKTVTVAMDISRMIRYPVFSRVVVAAAAVKVEDGSAYFSANIEFVYLWLRTISDSKGWLGGTRVRATGRTKLWWVKAVPEDYFPLSVVEEVTVVIEKAKLVSAAEETVNAIATTISTASTIPVSAATTTTTTTATITNVEVTLAQALAELKSAKPKVVKVVIKEPEQGTTTTTPITIIYVPKPPKDKGKGIMIEELVVEQVKPMKRLAQRLQTQEQEELTNEEKARLFIQFLEQRRKHFAAKREEEKRNRPPTRAQQRSIMCTYLKNMEGWKPKSLKNKSFANIQELFDKTMKRANTFVDYRTELVEESSKKAEIELEENSKKVEVEIAQESSSKRAGDELEQENANKQKVDKDKETIELQSLIEVVPDDEEEVVIDVVPLITKPPTIVD
ncbi:hypothetical protein Tco_0227288, partial [Tanacetum coccineum]